MLGSRGFSWNSRWSTISPITATFADLGVGRDYVVSISEGIGNAVPGYETPITVTAGAAPQTYSDLAPGTSSQLSIEHRDRFYADIRALEAKGLATMVSNPSVLTLENQPAVIDFNRTQYLTKRFDQVQQWADYLDKLRKGADVLPMPQRAA